MVFFSDDDKKTASRKLSNKLLLVGAILFTFIFMLNFTSSAEFDNKITYLDNNLKIELTNWFGLGTDYGTATLKSHKSVDEVISVGLGKQVTMYYDFEFNELYENGLGDVKFINMKNGQSVDKEYKFVYWVNETRTRDVYETVCPIALKGENVTCGQVAVGKEDYVVGSWQDYNIKTIPKGNIRIGIEVDNKQGDFIDGIWNIGGKDVSLHASWTADLNTDIVSYYKLDETSGTTAVDSLEISNGTSNAGVTVNQDGKIDKAYSFGAVDTAEIDLGTSHFDFETGDDWSISMWIKPNIPVDSTDRFLFSRQEGSGLYQGYSFSIRTQAGTKWFAMENVGSTGTNAVYWNYDVNAQNENWLHVVLTYDGTNVAKLYINNVEQTITSESGSFTGTLNSVKAYFGNRDGLDQGYRGVMDEIGVWERILTSTEVTQLYNEGSGITYTTDFGGITITDLSPANETNFAVDNIDFSANVTVTEISLNVSNVTLAITGEDTYNTTNTSGEEGIYTFEETGFADGDYNWQIFVYDTNGTEWVSDLYIFSVDTTAPTIEITYPIGDIDYQIDGNNETLNYSISDDNIDSCWYNYGGLYDSVYYYNTSINQSITQEYEQSYVVVKSWTYTEIGAGGYIESSSSVDISDCSDTELFSYPVAGFPTYYHMRVLCDSVDIGGTFGGQSNLSSTLYYGANNKTLNCSEDTTEFNYISGYNNLTVYANDNLGNEGSSITEWAYKVLENSQTYPTTSLESKQETYSVNITYNSTKYPIASGVLTFNNTNYTSTKTGTGDNAIFSRTVSMPELNTETNLTAFWTINLIEVEDVDAIELESHNVSVSIINFSLCDEVNTVPFWNFTILNESNNAVITSNFQAAFNVSPTGSGATNMFYYEDTSDSKSSYDFCITPGTEDYTITTVIQLSKTGYVVKNYNFQDIQVTNATREDNLYLLSLVDSTSFIVEVVTGYGSPVENAEVRVERFFPGTGTWAVTEILTTDFDGKSVGHLLSEDADYRFKVFQNGINVYNSTSTKITCSTAPCTVTLVIPVSINTGYEELENIISSLTFSSTTNIFTFTYEDTSSNFENARLYVYRIFPSNAIIYAPCDTTRTSASGVITCDISSSLNGTYRATGYVTRNGDETLVQRIDRVLGSNIYNSLGADGVFWAMFVFIGIVMIGVYRPSAGIIFGIVGLFIIKLIGLVNIGTISVVSISAIAIILLMRIGRE